MDKNKKGYTIRCHKQTSRGLITQTLGKDCIWYTACNDCSFPNLHEARRFFSSAYYELRGSSIWIEGPRGGIHKLFNR